jgi:enterochelin esterase-like enzyme
MNYICFPFCFIYFALNKLTITLSFMSFTKILFAVILVLSFGCRKTIVEPSTPVDYKKFSSVAELQKTLQQISEIKDSVKRTGRMNSLWDSLKANLQIPFVLGDSVAFLYRGDVTTLKWAGDFNNWSTSNSEFEGVRMGLSDVWILEKKFPEDARLDYKIVANGNWVLDPSNPYVQYSGFGPNSELRMPDWVFPEEVLPITWSTKGNLGPNLLIQSSTNNLGYTVNYRVYTPYNYANLNSLPVIYVTDGHEYTDDKLGSMITVLDNLIYRNEIEPIIAVFIDPRQPGYPSNNRRMSEYRANIRFANFVADELVPQVDASFKTNPAPEKRAILGTSLGGWNSSFFGIRRSDVFRLIGIHSPAFDQNIIWEYDNAQKLPLKIFMSTGVINDTEFQTRQMKTILDEKGYPLKYVEVNQGHSWGNWRALIDEPLIYFFPK